MVNAKPQRLEWPIDVLETQQIDDAVYEYLRNQIVRGIKPGTPLRLAEIAGALGVSTMPVRSALSRLESDGLVRKFQRRATVVAPMSFEDLEEIQAVRFGIEVFAGRLGVRSLSHSAINAMYDQLEVLENCASKISDPKVADAYLEADRSIHAICYGACGRVNLTRLLRVYERAAERYIRTALHANSDGVHSNTLHKRQFILACESGDPEQVERSVRRNLQWTLDLCEPLLT